MPSYKIGSFVVLVQFFSYSRTASFTALAEAWTHTHYFLFVTVTPSFTPQTPANQIPSVTVVVVVPVCKPRSQKPQEALNPSVTEERY
jgi:hypothetical protein